MTDDQHEKVVQIVNIISAEITNVVNEVLKHARPHMTEEMETLIRQQLTEQVRFWKGY